MSWCWEAWTDSHPARQYFTKVLAVPLTRTHVLLMHERSFCAWAHIWKLDSETCPQEEDHARAPWKEELMLCSWIKAHAFSLNTEHHMTCLLPVSSSDQQVFPQSVLGHRRCRRRGPRGIDWVGIQIGLGGNSSRYYAKTQHIIPSPSWSGLDKAPKDYTKPQKSMQSLKNYTRPTSIQK